ncbi:MAG: HD-GYP domain-containing protein, partial [Treponema sp.]|nr:HD-GYP domain-containing protein [Treponema sp.]
MMDRYAYIFRGDLSQFGWWAVRISNFMVFFLSLFLIYFFDLYLIDLYLREGNLPKAPKRLYAVGIFLALGAVLLVVNQFTGLYYAFDECNRYYRNKWFPVCYIIPYICLLMQFSVIVQYRGRLRPLVWIPIILFDLGPILSIVVQFFAYGISLQNLTVVGLVILLYIFVIVDMNKTVEQANKLKFELMEQEQHKMHTLFEQTAEALATAIDAKDKYTHGHSTRVAEYSKQIAILAGKSKEECDEIYYAGLLHDIGKIGVPRNIINKEGRLTDEEFAEIKKHPVMGNQILSSIGESPYLSIGAHYHHERYDGRGYPEGLKGTDIPDIARIIAVADAYDAMTSKRSYRDPIPQQKVREEIVKGMDSQFDPQYAKLMLHLIDLDSEYKMKEQQEVRELAGKNELNCTGFRQEKSEGIVV